MSVALVTGGSRGIGRAIVEEFAAAGYQVAFTYAGNQAAAESLAGVAASYQADSRNFARAEEVVTDVQSSLGPIAVLINNAGIKRDSALHNMDPAAWQEVIDTNLTGTFNYCRVLMKNFIRQGGSVINVTSVSGIIGMAGQTLSSHPDDAAYAGDIDDAAALPDKVLHQDAAIIECAGQVGVDDFLPGGRIHIMQRAVALDSRIVDQDGDRAE